MFQKRRTGPIMFSSVKKRVDETINTNDIETVIGRNTSIKGEISGSGNVRIDGHIEGGISIDGNAVVGETGLVEGDIKAKNLIVSGKVTGNADVEANLCIYATGQLIGDIRVSSFKVEDGGVFKGHSEMAPKSADTVADIS